MVCCMNGITQSEQGARLHLLGDIVFNAGYYQWQAILKFHAAILSEIENGNMQWGDCYSKLEQQMLMPFPTGKKNDKKRGNSPLGNQRSGRDNEHNGGHTEERIVYCSEYQNRNCQHTNDHSGQFFGQTTQMLHICAASWRRNKVKANIHRRRLIALIMNIDWHQRATNIMGVMDWVFVRQTNKL